MAAVIPPIVKRNLVDERPVKNDYQLIFGVAHQLG